MRDSIGDALADNAEGGTIRGASTISQQTAKNLFLWPAKSYIRKGVEAYLTFWLEVLWPKRRILEVYLNIAQFDDRVFGVGAGNEPSDSLYNMPVKQAQTHPMHTCAHAWPTRGSAHAHVLSMHEHRCSRPSS